MASRLTRILWCIIKALTSEFLALLPELLMGGQVLVSLLRSPAIPPKAPHVPFQCTWSSVLTVPRASLYVDLANQIRSGSTSQIPQYDELLYISNSYGSVLGVYIAQTYPDLFNTSVFTGYTKRILPSYYGIALQNPQSANKLFPERFPNPSFPLYVRTNLPYFPFPSTHHRSYTMSLLP